MKELEGQKRATIENIYPEIDCGKYPIKRSIDERVEVEADIFGDGHDKVDAVLLYRKINKGRGKSSQWSENRMEFIDNDHWRGSFTPTEVGDYEYNIEAWIDHFTTWQLGLKKKFEDNQDITTELLIGAEMVEDAISRATAAQKKRLKNLEKHLKEPQDIPTTVAEATSKETSDLLYETRDKGMARRFHKNLPLRVERKKAAFSAWYELFPRSASPEREKHGTFKDVEKILPEISKMGFDVIYLPPIHPIGRSFRKGLNNAVKAKPGDPGSPWAIGAEEGGHKAIHPELGSMEDFTSLVATAKEYDIEIALDFAIQCSPDHPYVKEHPQWFKWRPDGTVQYAENPPKKYQDVLPVNFETEDWENLWMELKSIVEFWIDKGVNIFRVDNPHTKPFIFWEWFMKEINAEYDGIIFLAEAFTRPRVMEKLAKVGFNQSYTYFTWRNTKGEFEKYLEELTKTEVKEYYRPNFWPNTPDILPISLENQDEPAFIIRLILAATLSSNYGIYGPIFEQGYNMAFPGKEEYIDSEKYEIKHWNYYKETKLKEVIIKINLIRRENTALQTTWNIEFCETDNGQILCYTKIDKHSGNHLIIIVSLDPVHKQAGWVNVPLSRFNLGENETYAVHDLLNGSRYVWQNSWNYVELHPHSMPAHIFRIEDLEK